MRRSRPFLFLAACLLAASTAQAAPAGKTVSMPFGECEAIVAEIAADLNVEPVVLASRADLRSVRIDAADGAVTVLCDGAKGTMSLSKTAHLVTASR
jgi:hypothetical protein